MNAQARALIERRYLELYAQENLGKTPKITEELDHIEEVLKCAGLEPESRHCLDLPLGERNGSTVPIATISQKPLTSAGGVAPGHCSLGG